MPLALEFDHKPGGPFLALEIVDDQRVAVLRKQPADGLPDAPCATGD